MQDIRIHISTVSLLKVLGVLALLAVLYFVRDIVLLLFVSLILAALIDPFAGWFARHRIPRALAVLLIYVVLFGLLGLAIALLTPVITNDVPQLIENLKKFFISAQESAAVQGFLHGLENIERATGSFGAGAAGSGVLPSQSSGVERTITGIFSTVTGVFGGIFSLGLVLVMTFYMVVQDDPLKKILRSIAPDEYVPYFSQLFKKMRDKLGDWMRGQLVLSLVIGLLVFAGLLALGIKYAAVLGLLAAFFEFIPYLGPILAAIPALFFAFSQGGFIKFLFVAIMYLVIQQIENQLLVPKIMQRAVGLNPIVSIVAILVGAKLAGLVGVLLAIPVATVLSVFLQDVLVKKTE